MRKSNEHANKCRDEGNKLYSTRNFFDALLKYNESLCYALDESVSALAYANRSAVYFEIKLYEHCLTNIEFAKLNKYPEKNAHILLSRSEKCVALMNRDSDKHRQLPENLSCFTKLSYKENSQMPFIVDCLELRTNDVFGRHIVTTRDLKVGDMLTFEEPYFKVIKSDSRYESCQELNKYQRCAACLRDNLMDLIPCKKCISTMYCSQKCLEYADRNFHNYECNINETLLKAGIMQMVMRVFFQSLNIFNGSIDELEKFLNDCTKTSTCVYDFDFSTTDEHKLAKSYLLSSYNLARNEAVTSDESSHSIFMLDPLLIELWDSHSIFITKFIKRFIKIYDSNFHGICGWSVKKSENYEAQMIGVGCYCFSSLINHSCSPCINRLYSYDKLIIVVDRPIKKGEQLFDCYRSPFFKQSKSERQYSLLNEYAFRCQCEACVKNYPLFHSLKSFNKKLLKYAKKSKNEIQKLDFVEAQRKFQEICSIIQDSKEYPSSEIILLQECVQQCLSIILKPKNLIL
ncbi:hypothetical protein PVAND_002464 [Polypedilum vanderplanki]|uniref:Uncharacterized protein n=1 Tax=Polypedilum vanderplanki TaxID=319348 RepID=A0A9J6BRF9_POLVA|nr:hypothetical protein PVAND_002464 [Polypedilum vanderplanki]